MRKIFLITGVVLMATVALNAQQISVVSSSGTTTLYTDLNLAIQGAAAGSTVYLSGGGFQIHDSTKITKQLTIIGIGHKTDNDNGDGNADGNTVVSGNFFFNEGSDNSALMGVFLSNDVYIGTSSIAVNTILVRYCNINAISVGNSNCQGVLINQNYIRGPSSGGNSAISFTNNVLHSINYVTGGVIDHNVIRHNYSDFRAFYSVSNSRISNNILIDPNRIHSGSNCVISNNMLNTAWGDTSYRTITISSWDDVFVGPITAISPSCNYHLKVPHGTGAATDGTDVGIYGGTTGFSDSALPPIPRIVSKTVSEQTDENGNLKINVRVKSQ
jgi:hypothetical protein